jgi:hypothetical protein
VQLRNAKYTTNKKSPNNAFYNGFCTMNVIFSVANRTFSECENQDNNGNNGNNAFKNIY